MAFPQNISEMTTMGYKPTGEGLCGKCGAQIAWWRTPNDKPLPYEPGTATPHFKNCGTVKPLSPKIMPTVEIKQYGEFAKSDTVTITLSRAGAEKLRDILSEALDK